MYAGVGNDSNAGFHVSEDAANWFRCQCMRPAREELRILEASHYKGAQASWGVAKVLVSSGRSGHAAPTRPSMLVSRLGLQFLAGSPAKGTGAVTAAARSAALTNLERRAPHLLRFRGSHCLRHDCPGETATLDDSG